MLVVGSPDGQDTALSAVEPADAAEAKLELSKPITNGLTYDFTFTFEKRARPRSLCRSPPARRPVAKRRGAGGSESHSGGGH